MSNQINAFRKQYWFLSNFCKSFIKYKGKVYPTAEHLYQALKTKNKNQRNKIRKVSTPTEAKVMGRHVELRDDWEEVKDKLMYMVVRLKFLQKSELKLLLKNTDNKQLIEGNYWHDNYWGNCTCFKCKNIKGRNQLGKTLMKIRIMI